MRVVLDTNVLVSGLLNPFGTCGQIVRLLASDEIVLCVDARILLEYDEVLRRPKFAIASQDADALMEFIQDAAEVHGSIPLAVPLPDANDSPFLEVALAAKAEGLVTGNARHFPLHGRAGMPVFSPRQFIEKVLEHMNKPPNAPGNGVPRRPRMSDS